MFAESFPCQTVVVVNVELWLTWGCDNELIQAGAELGQAQGKYDILVQVRV